MYSNLHVQLNPLAVQIIDVIHIGKDLKTKKDSIASSVGLGNLALAIES